MYTPPTDNLYKFMALGGIALFIAAQFNYRAASSKLRDQSIETRYLTDKANIEQTHLAFTFTEYTNLASAVKKEMRQITEKTIPDIRKQISALQENSSSPTSKQKQAFETLARVQLDVNGDIKTMEGLANVYKKNLYTFNQRAIDCTKSYEQEKNLNRELKRLYHETNIAYVISVILCFGGFNLWYRKHQRYLDTIQKLEGLKAQAELDKLTTPQTPEEEAE